VTTAKFLTIVLLLTGASWASAQTASQPEVFTGTAQAKNATGAVSGALELRLRR
jgi:hypothetical protein